MRGVLGLTLPKASGEWHQTSHKTAKVYTAHVHREAAIGGLGAVRAEVQERTPDGGCLSRFHWWTWPLNHLSGWGGTGSITNGLGGHIFQHCQPSQPTAGPDVHSLHSKRTAGQGEWEDSKHKLNNNKHMQKHETVNQKMFWWYKSV